MPVWGCGWQPQQQLFVNKLPQGCLVTTKPAFYNSAFCLKAAFTESRYTPAFHKSGCCAPLLQVQASNPSVQLFLFLKQNNKNKHYTLMKYIFYSNLDYFKHLKLRNNKNYFILYLNIKNK